MKTLKMMRDSVFPNRYNPDSPITGIPYSITGIPYYLYLLPSNKEVLGRFLMHAELPISTPFRLKFTFMGNL